MRRVFRHLQTDTDPRRSPSARSEMVKETSLGLVDHPVLRRLLALLPAADGRGGDGRCAAAAKKAAGTPTAGAAAAALYRSCCLVTADSGVDADDAAAAAAAPFALLDRRDLAVDELLVRLDVVVLGVDDLLDDGDELLLVRCRRKAGELRLLRP